MIAFMIPFIALNANEMVVNGDFETNDLSGWTVVDGGQGAFFTYSGTTTPLGNPAIAAPYEGTYAAITDQHGPGNHIIYQDIALPIASSIQFSIVIWIKNYANDYYIPNTLAYNSMLNQQMRIDIMNPNAPLLDVSNGVLQNIFQTQPGNPLSMSYQIITADLTPFAGQTIRLRIAEVDNLGVFNGAVDKVSIQTVTSVPLSNSTKALLAFLFAYAAFFMLPRRKKVV